MSRRRFAAVIAAIAALGLVGAGCGDSDDSSSGGGTPAASTPSAPAGTSTTEAAAGDAAAGKTFYESTCQGCHGAGGVDGPSGPPLAKKGLTAEAIATQVKTPKNKMPANLASGADLDNVAAYIVSLQ